MSLDACLENSVSDKKDISVEICAMNQGVLGN